MSPPLADLFFAQATATCAGRVALGCESHTIVAAGCGPELQPDVDGVAAGCGSRRGRMWSVRQVTPVVQYIMFAALTTFVAYTRASWINEAHMAMD